MSGSSTPMRALSRPLELGARVLVASVLVVWLLHALQRPIVQPFIPVFRAAVRLVAIEFTIDSAEIVQENGNETLRFRANLAAPLRLAGRRVYPFGWNGTPAGGFQVLLTLGGLLQYSALMLIVAMAWPARGLGVLLVRLALCVPLVAVLLMIEVPSTVVAELWGALRDWVGFDPVCAWMVWSRFLMGGGGLLLGCLAAVLVIAAARKLTDRGAARRETGPARQALGRTVATVSKHA